MARESTTSKRRNDEDDEDEQPVRKGRASRDDDEDEPKARKGRASADDDDDEVSLDDEDAIETGLFASGAATIKEAVFDNYKYGDTGTAAPAFIVVYERDGEPPYEQPYSIGSGWAIKNGKLIAKNGQTGLPKSCNAIRHFVKPYKQACADAGVNPVPLKPSTIGEIAGLQVMVERVEQEDRKIDDRKGGDRERGRAREDRSGRDEKKRGPRTILEIREILDGDAKGGAKKKKKDDDEDEAPKSTKKGKPADDDEEDEPADDEPEEKPAAKKGAKETVSDEDAVEALLDALADGPLKMGEELEDALEAVLKGKKGAGAVVDLASSKKFLQTEQGWSFDGKIATLAKKKAARK